MKRIAIFVILAVLIVAWPLRARGQNSGLADYERQSRETYKKQQKEAKRAVKQQRKLMRKASKKQRKAMKKYEKQLKRQSRK